MSLLLALFFGLLAAGSSQARRKVPSAHLEGGVTAAVDYPKDTIITAWDPQHPNSHLVDGFKYSGGKLRVPKSGRYFVYTQVYFNWRQTPNRVTVKTTSRNLFLIHTSLGNSEETTDYSGGMFELKANEEIYVEVIGFDTKMWVGPAHSFFGAYQLK